MSIASDFLAFDDALGRVGVPPLSQWWRNEATRFLTAHERGEATEWWCCAGRGGAKSTASYKLALFQTLFGQFNIPSDERHYAICISRTRDEAGKGVAIVCNWLTKLGITYRAVGDSIIELHDSPRGIRIVSASVGAASGWRAYHLACDEFAKFAAGDLSSGTGSATLIM